MDELRQRKTPRLQGYNYNRAGVYFITLCTKDQKCILSKIVGTGVPDCPQAPDEHVGTGVLDCPQIILSKYGAVAEKYLIQMNDFYDHISIKKYVIMPNHIHILLSIKENGQSGTPVPTHETQANSAYSQFVSTFKRFCNKEYGENIWQARSYDHIIRNREDYEEHLRYISDNPFRWYYDDFYSNE